MSIFDIFKTQWSAGKMTQDDRKKLFWYLKRKTSYTAWKRVADAFDRFANIFEKQVREEPIAKAEMRLEDMHWDTSYPEILKGQLLYEQALERLMQGDRTIFLYNSRGAMDDASTISGHWYSELVNNGMRGDHFYDGKYVDELTRLMEEFSLVRRDAGYLQPMMADTPAPELWSTMWLDDFAKMPIPEFLPDVPAPETEILIKTGEEVPVFGIYEPQIKDGCMNYLLAGVPAPKSWASDGTYATGEKRSVVWRLLWEDTRYLDGEIPVEEIYYFPPETKAEQPSLTTVAKDLISATTNQLCPKDGAWAVMDDLNAKSVLKKGDKMPQHNGREVTWVWLE